MLSIDGSEDWMYFWYTRSSLFIFRALYQELKMETVHCGPRGSPGSKACVWWTANVQPQLDELSRRTSHDQDQKRSQIVTFVKHSLVWLKRAGCSRPEFMWVCNEGEGEGRRWMKRWTSFMKTASRYSYGALDRTPQGPQPLLSIPPGYNTLRMCMANHCNPLHWQKNIAPKIFQLFSILQTDSIRHGTSHHHEGNGFLIGIAFKENVI